MFAEGYTKPERENDWLHIPEKGKEKLGQPVIFFKQTRMAQLHKKLYIKCNERAGMKEIFKYSFQYKYAYALYTTIKRYTRV